MFVAALAGVIALTSVGAAAGDSTKQHVAITSRSGVNSFVLRPLARGPLARDSGVGSWCCWSQVFVTHDGERVEVDDPTLTLTGGQGTLVLKLRVEWVDAGNGYTVGTGTWKVVRGSGGYANLAGGGWSAHLWIGQNATSWRLDGVLSQK